MQSIGKRKKKSLVLSYTLEQLPNWSVDQSGPIDAQAFCFTLLVAASLKSSRSDGNPALHSHTANPGLFSPPLDQQLQ